jgi:alpha-N-arabinofuranosidase
MPAIPVYHSKDLVNWKMKGHVINRNSQLEMEGFNHSEGVYAPTIRYYKGTFYVVISIVERNPLSVKNVLFTSDSLMKEWSEPIVLTDTSLWAIDPSLFFDDDGKCYFTANRKHQEKQPYPSYREIAIQEYSIKDQELFGSIEVISKGEVRGAHNPEGPHIYKKDGWYYLLISEGGTGITHAVTITRSKDIWGPYEPCHHNPILTHRFMMNTVSLRNLGHADIIQTNNDKWYMVFLGVRYTNDWSMMGRETFMVPMIWEEGKFPVVNPGYSMVQNKYPLPFAGELENNSKRGFTDDFNNSDLNPEWTFLRSIGDFYNLTGDALELKIKPSTIEELSTPCFIGKRIENSNFETSLSIDFKTKKNNEEAGIIILATNTNYVKMMRTKDGITIETSDNGTGKVVASMNDELPSIIYMKVRSDEQRLSFDYSTNGKQWKNIKNNLEVKMLGKYWFTGNFIGIYGTSNGLETNNHFTIENFVYKNK